MSEKKSTEFLKDLSLTDKVLYASCGIGNIENSIWMSENADECYQLVSEFTVDLKGYLNKLSLILRDLGISCPKLQDIDLTDLVINSEDITDFENSKILKYFDSIEDRLLSHKNYCEIIEKNCFGKYDIDLSKL